MALVTMSNPPSGLGLDLAVLGNPPRRSKNMARRRVYRPRARSRGGWYVMNPSMIADTRAMLEGSSAYAGPEYGDTRIRTGAKRSAAAKKAAATRKRNKAAAKAAAKKVAIKRAVARSKITKSQRTRWARKGWRSRRRAVPADVGRFWLNRTLKGSGRHAGKITHTKRVYRTRKGGVKRARKLYGKYGGKSGKYTISGQEWRKGHKGSRRVSFNNPPLTVRGYFGGLTGALPTAMQEVQRKPLLHGALLFGGMAATYMAGGFIAARTINTLSMIPGVAPVIASDMGKRVVGGLLPYTLGYAASFFIPARQRSLRMALVTGGALASIVSVVAPRALDTLFGAIAGPAVATAITDEATQDVSNAENGGANGLGAYAVLAGHCVHNPVLAGYVEAPAYAGAGAYVEAPSYAGAGGDPTALAGYVEAPAYAGAGDMDGYLDQNYLTSGYLNAAPAAAGGAYG